MFICTIIVVVAIVRKTVYMQECMNNILLQCYHLAYTIYRFTCTQHALIYIIVCNVNAPSVPSFTCLLSIDQFVII